VWLDLQRELRHQERIRFLNKGGTMSENKAILWGVRKIGENYPCFQTVSIWPDFINDKVNQLNISSQHSQYERVKITIEKG
jgi:hypothetical protein